MAGMTAPQAAGAIHSDFEKGFIRAETIAYEDYVKAKGCVFLALVSARACECEGLVCPNELATTVKSSSHSISPVTSPHHIRYNAAKEAGMLRSEGKEYVVKEVGVCVAPFSCC